MDSRVRCSWCLSDPLYIAYHDEEWGRPLHDDRQLFEMLNLEGAQAGLSWITVLKKRENYRRAFDGFDPEKMARYTSKKVDALLADAGIIRNRLKVASFIDNAKAYLAAVEEFGSFDTFIWRYVEGQPIVHHYRNLGEIPAKSEISDRMSKDLKKRGFRFVGSTICQAYMQAVGMFNDHTLDCWTRRS